MTAKPVMTAVGLRKWYPAQGAWRRTSLLHAVDGIDLVIHQGEVVGVVGESGCGKTTLGRLLLGFEPPTGGSVTFEGKALHQLPARDLRRLRPRLQMIFQDPYASLNPLLTAGQMLLEAVRHSRTAMGREAARVDELLGLVGLAPHDAPRFPREFSGGQRQRLCIARALAVEPTLVIADEPTSALDVSVQANILALLQDLQRRMNLTMVFISHDLAVIRNISDRIIVMYLGQVVEEGPTDAVFAEPRHPYTMALVTAIPSVSGRGRRHVGIEGDPPNAVDPPATCRFYARCHARLAVCRTVPPPRRRLANGRTNLCHLEDAAP